MKNLATIAATAIVLLILLATTLPLMHWFTSAGRDAALSESEALWSTLAINSYDLSVRKSCECPAPAGTDVRFSVQGDVVTAQPSLENDISYSIAEIREAAIPETVPMLFEVVRDAIADDPDLLHIEYDPDYGFPREIRIDRRKAYDNDQVTYRVSNFRPRLVDAR